MKIPVYQNQGQVGTPAVDLTNVQYNNAGQQALVAANGGVAKTFAGGMVKLQQQAQLTKVLQATNDYNDAVSKLSLQIRNDQKEGNADTATQNFIDGEAKIRGQIAKKYGSDLDYGEAGQAYQRMIDKDFVTRRTNMMGYQMQEMEKNTMTQYGLAQKATLDMVGNNYGEKEATDSAMNRAAAIANGTFWNYGPDRIKAETAKAQGQLASSMITQAIGNSDWTNANKLLINYGDKLDPEKKSSFGKMVNDQIKANQQASTFDELYKKHPDDLDGFLKDAEASFTSSSGYDGNAAVEYARSQIGKQLGVNTCTIFANSCLGQGKGNQGNVWAPNRWKEVNAKQKFTDRNQLRNGDIVYWDADNGGEASHVGIYDAEKGQVIQSGTSGVAYLDIDKYKVVGFAHPQGTGPASPLERQQYLDKATAYWNKQNSIKNEISNALIDKGQLALSKASTEGTTSESELMNIAAQNSLNSDGTVNQAAYDKLSLIATKFARIGAGRSGSGGGGSSKLDFDSSYEFENICDNGGMDETELIKRCKDAGLPDSTIMGMVKKNRAALKNEGDYQYNYSAMKGKLIEDGLLVKGDDWSFSGAVGVAKRYIHQYRQTNGAMPSDADVYAEMQEAMIKGVGGVKQKITVHHWYGDETTYGDGYNSAGLRHYKIYSIKMKDDGTVDVYEDEHDEPVNMSLSDFQNMVGD